MAILAKFNGNGRVCLLIVLLAGGLGRITAAPGSATAPPARIECQPGRPEFRVRGTGRPFRVWGLNYDRDARGRLIEDYWRDEWPKVEADFAAMKRLGANVVRVHLQLGRFLPEPGRPDAAELGQLGRLLVLAERLGLYVDLTGLGCYDKAAVPAWYDARDEVGRWRAQAEFWEAVAGQAAGSPSVFCYDLMNEPVVPGDRQAPRDWLGSGPGLAGKFYVQKITLDPAGRPRPEVARAWIRTLRDAIRRHDPDRLITVGMVDWSLDEPRASFSGITPAVVAAELDFVAVHVYPETGKVEDALARLKRFQVGTKPVLVEETFPLKCAGAEFAAFATAARDTTGGLVGFFWGEDQAALRPQGTLNAALTAGWLDEFERLRPPAPPAP